MKTNKEKALELWDETYKNKEEAKDFAGRVIKRSAYGNKDSQYRWNIGHIFPESRGGSDEDENLQITHYLTNDEKGDSFPGFVANGKPFTCKRVKGKSRVYKVHPVVKK